MRRVLVFAYYFPPMGLSGVQRTVKFLKHLPRFGWQPTVVTCRPGGYFAYDDRLLEEVESARIAVHRTASWDPTQLFGGRTVVEFPQERTRRIWSRLSQWIFVPDNKLGWRRSAGKEALHILRRQPFDAVFSSAPPYTSHLAAADAATRTGLPLVLDFRDDWVGNPRHIYPTFLHRSLSMHLERRALRAATHVVTINEVMQRNLAKRHPDVLTPGKATVISQGYDPTDFDVQPCIPGIVQDPRIMTLVYSGMFYDAQSPDPLLQGLAHLFARRPPLKGRIRAVFVGMLPASSLALAVELGLSDTVHHVGYLPHPEAVSCLLAADVLWMIIGRGRGCERISTGKLYEYFGTGKPILGLVPPGPDREALERYGAAEIVEPDAVPDIGAAIERFYDQWMEDRLPRPPSAFVDRFDRKHLTGKLARVFEEAVQNRR